MLWKSWRKGNLSGAEIGSNGVPSRAWEVLGRMPIIVIFAAETPNASGSVPQRRSVFNRDVFVSPGTHLSPLAVAIPLKDAPACWGFNLKTITVL